jgi:2-amino-4-hydroxy-6-hydroxymethyldihydropteridine diphosphokinase
MSEKRTLYLGLGTNQGNKEMNLTRAIELLSLAFGHCTAKSAFIETAPWGFNSNNTFLNCCIAFDTTLQPLQILDITERIERELGRTTKSTGGTYHDRIIDIDILLYGSETISTERLTIPHPLMHKRDFVLEPLAEIAPDVIHPIIGKSINDLLQELKNEE